MNEMAVADAEPGGGGLPGRSLTPDTADRLGGVLPMYRVRRVMNYIEANLQRELRLAELSAVVHMSPYHFARLFKRSTGVPPYRFLVWRRIDEARVLLAAQTAPIAEIARRVGFRTPSHFTTTFRRFTGMTPTAYRRGSPCDPLEKTGSPVTGSVRPGVSTGEADA